jgi:hypothetical protein
MQTNNLKKISYLFCLILITGCGLFKKAPEFEGIAISPNKEKIIQLYSVYHITSYSKGGGLERSTGYKKYYLDLYDAKTGKKYNDKSIEVENGGPLKYMTETTFLLTSYNSEKNRSELKIYDFKGNMKFDAEALKNINGGLLFDYSLHYTVRENKRGYTVEGDDGRIYQLDDESGKAEKLNEDDLIKNVRRDHFKPIHSFYNDSLNYRLEGKQRNRLYLRVQHERDSFQLFKSSFGERKFKRSFRYYEEYKSLSDFIDGFIMGENRLDTVIQQTPDDYPFETGNMIFVFSTSKSSNKFEWVFTALQKNDLKEKWIATLTNPLAEKQAEGIKDVLLIGNDFIILTDQSLNRLDLNTGKWIWNYRYIKEIED